ncbi:16285_t:CDS:2, partial [Gigaspora rosea]
ENDNPTPNRVDICDAAAKEWKNIKKFKKTRIDDIIKGYLDTPIKLRGFIGTTISSKKTKVPDTISNSYRTVEIIPIEQEIRNNAPAQKRTASSIEAAEAKIKELEQIYNFTSDSQLRIDLYNRITNLKVKIQSNKETLRKLKRNANYQFKWRKKSNQRNFDEEEEQNLNESANTSVPWSWIEKHCSLCQYSINIKRCNDLSCCGPTRAQEAIDFLQPFDGFLPPVTKARDSHYINPVHLLQYSERFKVPGYDAHCSSINQTMYSRLCCSICYKYFPTLLYVAKHKRFQHSSNRRKAKKEPEISESVAEFVVISNSATMEDLDLSLLQRNESLDEYRECFSDVE